MMFLLFFDDIKSERELVEVIGERLVRCNSPRCASLQRSLVYPRSLLGRVRVVLRRVQFPRQKQQASLARSADSRRHAFGRHRQDVRIRKRQSFLLSDVLAACVRCGFTRMGCDYVAQSSDHSMKPTAPLRNNSSVFATTSCRGLSFSRWATA
jgi:hypothetical protein